VSLALQAGGGATSSTSTGSNQVGINISLAGLALQVFTLLVFILASADYMIRFHRTTVQPTKTRFNIFTVFLALSIVLILVRCIYRIDELSDGYSGALFHNEGVFYGLESA
jgi:tellurite resistance protein TehA-like permease